jgi:hypothetical protein
MPIDSTFWKIEFDPVADRIEEMLKFMRFANAANTLSVRLLAENSV